MTEARHAVSSVKSVSSVVHLLSFVEGRLVAAPPRWASAVSSLLVRAAVACLNLDVGCWALDVECSALFDPR